MQSVCMSKSKQDTGVRYLRQLHMNEAVRRSIPPLHQQVKLHGHRVNFEIDSRANNIYPLCSKEAWIKSGKPKLQEVEPSTKLRMETNRKYWEI